MELIRKNATFCAITCKTACRTHLLPNDNTAVMVKKMSYVRAIKTTRKQEINTYGFLGYFVLMATDILIYKANKVPVGKDQESHIELTLEIARRFNYIYKPVFPEPKPFTRNFCITWN